MNIKKDTTYTLTLTEQEFEYLKQLVYEDFQDGTIDRTIDVDRIRREFDRD